MLSPGMIFFLYWGFRLLTSSIPMPQTSVICSKCRLRFTYHRIRNGETLSTIARKYGVTVSQIKSWNGLRSTRINAGKRLKIYK